MGEYEYTVISLYIILLIYLVLELQTKASVSGMFSIEYLIKVKKFIRKLYTALIRLRFPHQCIDKIYIFFFS